MLDRTAVQGFQWDFGNARKNDKHGVTQQEAEQVSLNQPVLLLEDVRHSGNEARFHALGQTSVGRMLHVAFTIRGAGTLIHVISARPMHRRERIVYGQATEAHS